MIILDKSLHLPWIDTVLKKAVDDALIEIAMNHHRQGMKVFRFSPFSPISLDTSERSTVDHAQVLTVDLRHGGTVEGTAIGFFQAARDDIVRKVLEKVIEERHLVGLMDALLSGDGS